MARVFTIPIFPDPARRRGIKRKADSRYLEGQRILVEAMKYLAHADAVKNRTAIELISEHVRTRFRMSYSPLA